MSTLFDDPAPLPWDYWADLSPIAPITQKRRVRDVQPLRVTLLGDYTQRFREMEEWRRGPSGRPELYPEWLTELHAELIEQTTPDGHYALPCDTCKAVIVTPVANGNTCPRCGR